MQRIAFFTLASTFVFGSCLAMEPDEELVGEQQEQILTGMPDVSEFPNVVAMRVVRPPDDEGDPQDDLLCTGTLVEACTVLTSAHCVYDNVEAGTVADIDLRSGAGFSDGTPLPIESIEIHRYFNPDASNVNELALIRIQDGSCPAVTPATIYDEPITDSDVERPLTLVGYGITVEATTNDGSRTKVDTPIVSVGPRHVFAGTDDVTTCAGDSGGPGFLDVVGEPELATMTVLQGGCARAVQRTRLDLYTESFLYPFIDRFSGACTFDGECVTDGCRSPDPDCDDCLWGNDVCGTGCETRDWDCDLGSFVGEACESNDDCEELGRCIAATDDETFTYCARPCDPAAASPDCPSGMECTDLGGGDGECTWLEPSPGSQGASCVSNDQCRSGICENDICVFECGDGNSCPDPFTCGPSEVSPGTMVCLGEVLEGGGGFCAVGGEVRDWLAPLLLALFGLPLITRRRRRA